MFSNFDFLARLKSRAAFSCIVLFNTAALCVDNADSLVGTYRRVPVENPWHEGSISIKADSGGRLLEWKNKAGVRWTLIPDWEKGVLNTDETNPYFKKGGTEFRLEKDDGKIIGFAFNSDVFYRDLPEGITLRLPQKAGGLKGYISMRLGAVPAGYGYGVSFYVAAWPLLEKPLAGFQVGLPSTWIKPENSDFKQPLCPPGTVARDRWPERGPYYRDVFQTIEGGLGFWVSTQFASGTPKYRVNGTPNGYNHEVSSPGWGFGRTAALSAKEMGIAQLSNRLLLPPDGLTFKAGAAGELLGNAWMALPLTKSKQRDGVSTGEHSWTLFLNAENFKGPVACWIPETWSRLSQSYREIDGRGLDSRPGLMSGGAMEVNTVPYLEATDSHGVRYTRVPRVQFPVNERGESVLMQDVVMYSEQALFKAVKATATGAETKGVSWKIDPKAGFHPTVQANPIVLKQGGENLVLGGIEEFVRTELIENKKARIFGLKWKQAKNWAALPEYYRQEGGKMVAVSANAVPPETGLTRQSFRAAGKGRAYTSPGEESTEWRQPGPKAGPFTATLSDGSVVTYA
ncbi:MAG: hypothetical protein EBS01_09695, partial [Verrucomicrobia bacterium]|nr:hypothetical protein [Verrucomicrobiota bacterium]